MSHGGQDPNPKPGRAGAAAAIGSGAVAIAVGVAVLVREPAPEPASPAPAAVEQSVEAPALDPAVTPAPLDPPVAAPAAADPPPAARPRAARVTCPPGPPAFTLIVAFAPSHPLGAAQALAAQGRRAEATAAAQAALSSHASVRGLCLVDFTIGGAEVVLAPAVRLGPGEAQAAAARWAAQLSARSDVVYATPNIEVRPEGKPSGT